MALKLIRVLFGAQSNAAIEDEVRVIYNNIAPEDRSIMEFTRDGRVNAALVVQAGGTVKYFGPQAMKFLRSYRGVVVDALQTDYRMEESQEMPVVDPASCDTHLSKTRYAPYAQVSDRGRTTGPHYQYVHPKFLPEENMGMYEKDDGMYALTTRFPSADHQPMYPDGRTRLPYTR